MHWICKQEIIDQPLSVFLLNFHWGATQNVTDRHVWKQNTMLNSYGGWQSTYSRDVDDLASHDAAELLMVLDG